jgi:hypothetical protein
MKRIGIVDLTRADWEEIIEALRTKEWLVKRGDYGTTDQDCDVEAWGEHLETLRTRIENEIGG